MTQEEYINVIQSFAVFSTFEPEVQQIILQASEAQMERYIEILSRAQDSVDKNRDSFFEKCREILSNFKLNIKKIKTEKRTGDEALSTHEDEKAEQELLEKLSQL